MSKTYETWEVIKAFSQNPNLKFETERGNKIYFNNDGILVIGNELELRISDAFIRRKWKLVQEPVDFVTAFNAWQVDGKVIRVEIPENIVAGLNRTETFIQNCFNLNRSIPAEYILNGKWYIEEGEE